MAKFGEPEITGNPVPEIQKSVLGDSSASSAAARLSEEAHGFGMGAPAAPAADALALPGALGNAVNLESHFAFLQPQDILSAQSALGRISTRIGAAADTAPGVTSSFGQLKELMRPSNVTGADLADSAWQMSTQGRIMSVSRALAGDGWEEEAASVLEMLPK